MHEEMKANGNSQDVPMIDQVVAKLKEDNVKVNDFMFFQLINIAGLAPGEYQKLPPEEQERRWNLLFSLPQAEASE